MPIPQWDNSHLVISNLYFAVAETYYRKHDFHNSHGEMNCRLQLDDLLVIEWNVNPFNKCRERVNIHNMCGNVKFYADQLNHFEKFFSGIAKNYQTKLRFENTITNVLLKLKS